MCSAFTAKGRIPVNPERVMLLLLLDLMAWSA